MDDVFPESVSVRLDFSKSSKRFLDALAALLLEIDGADPALLQDSIRDAGAEVIEALQEPDGLGFSVGP